jgi:CheY-like chemotaxis protein
LTRWSSHAERKTRRRSQCTSGCPQCRATVNAATNRHGASCRATLAAAEAFPQVHAAIGRHPNSATGFDDADLAELEALAAHERCVAIGETGLDHYRDHTPREDQVRAFAAQMDLARRAGKPVVIATQMLESMIQSPVPTRAEVSDVATAVYEGADAIMLSAESAAGKFPVEAVSTMNRIGEEVERDPTYRSVLTAQRPQPENTVGDAIADAARQIAETLELSAIICWTSSGSTAIRVARERPKPPVVAITPNLATGRKLSVVWGVHCVVAEDAHDQDDMVDRAGSIAFRDGFANAGQRVIIVDDSKAIRVIVGRTMKELGFEIIEASNGAEALERLVGTTASVALVDWNMPVMDGLAFVKAVRADARHADMRIMMITTENDLGRVQSALEAGADEFLMKPFTKDVLSDKLALFGIAAVNPAAPPGPL